jgi:hypothetical protein
MNRPLRQHGARLRKTSRISPMTRAIRDAMAVSVAMLALSAVPVVHAGARAPAATPLDASAAVYTNRPSGETITSAR